MEQGPDFGYWFDTTQFSYHCVHPIHAINPNVTTFQSNCAEGLHFSAFSFKVVRTIKKTEKSGNGAVVALKV